MHDNAAPPTDLSGRLAVLTYRVRRRVTAAYRPHSASALVRRHGKTYISEADHNGTEPGTRLSVLASVRPAGRAVACTVTTYTTT